MQLYVWTNIFFLKCSSRKFVTGTFFPMIVTQILQMAFAGLVANGAIQWMIQQKKFNYSISCVNHPVTGNIFNYHTIHHRSAATCYQFRHRPWVSRRTSGYFYQAGAALTTTALQLAVE